MAAAMAGEEPKVWFEGLTPSVHSLGSPGLQTKFPNETFISFIHGD